MIVEYLDEKLPNFPTYFSKKYPTISKNESETTISQSLCAFLEDFKNPDEASLFRFHPEFKESRYAVDFAVIDVKSCKNTPEPPKPIFTIEAKRLPAPKKTKKDHSRKKEYVCGNGGGIERYKKGKHGKGLTQSAIIGYIQDKDCNYWFKFINKWIQQLSSHDKDNWEPTELLKLVSIFTNTQKFISDNVRKIGKKKDSIRMWHYLIELK